MSAPRQYVAPNLAEAATRIKAELGSDAVILRTRTVRQGPLWGLLGRPMVEVTVAAPAAPPAQAAGAATSQLLAVEAMRRELEAVRGALDGLQQSQAVQQLAPQARELYSTLRRQGVSEELGLRLLSRVRLDRLSEDAAAWRHLLRRQLLQHLGEPQPLTVPRGQGYVAALVGPTGVGKTTTVAKLAAHFSRHYQMKVGVLCLDTQRIGAEAQLGAYCQLLGLPMLVAEDAAEIREARQALAGCDLILADTAGRGPRGSALLRAQLAALGASEIYLVLSATTGEADARATVEAFSGLGCTRLLGTKLDETSAPGGLLNLRAACRLPLSYVGTGQRVPGDLELVNPGLYCESLLDGRPHWGEVQPC